MAVLFTLLPLGLTACSSYSEYADSDSEAATEQSTVLPVVTSESVEPAPVEEVEPVPSTINDVDGEETTVGDQGQSPAKDDEVERANRWNGSDLDCSEFTIADIPITGSDPNGLDGEGDGVGCES